MKLARPDLGSLLFICRNLRAADREEVFATRWDDDPDALAIDLHRCGGFSWVDGVGGEPIVAIGAMPMWPGVWSLWMVATDRFPEVATRLTRFAHRVMLPAVVEAGCHRGEARSLHSHHQAHAWMESLGAKREPVLRQYGREKQDFYLFVWEV